MKMKRRILYAIGLASVMLLSSCDSFLDITPDGQVKRDDILSDEDGIESALYGAYAQLRDDNLYGRDLSFYMLEIMSQTFDCYGNDAITALSSYNYSYSSVEDEFESIWTDMYANISNVNSVLDGDLIANATEYPYTIYRGEALGLRAFMHFDLMRIFAQQYTVNPSASGIPYANTFSLNTPDFESLEKNYAHVIADLREAETLLADEDSYVDERLFMSDREIHFNLYAVEALLARVYLTKGDLDSAYYYADKVIKNSSYQLKEKTEVNNDLAGVLSRKETIWGVYYSSFYNNVSDYLQKTTSYTSIDPRDDILDMYEQNVNGLDYRSNAYFTSVDVGGTEKVRLSKLTDIYELQGITSSRPSDLILGINLIRIPEMYYICAEALLNTDYDKAVEYYDEVITHRGLEPLGDDEVLTQDMINTERYKEYIGEGQTFFNMKRQNLSILSVDSKKTYSPSSDIYVVPIPESETENRY